MRSASTVAVWTLSIVTLLVAGLVALLFVQMAFGMDPTDLVTDGTQSWSDALRAATAFAALLVATAVSLRLWHTRRFKVVGLVLMLLDAGLVIVVCARVYGEYF